jgi:hypothetical protein
MHVAANSRGQISKLTLRVPLKVCKGAFMQLCYMTCLHQGPQMSWYGKLKLKIKASVLQRQPFCIGGTHLPWDLHGTKLEDHCTGPGIAHRGTAGGTTTEPVSFAALAGNDALAAVAGAVPEVLCLHKSNSVTHHNPSPNCTT